MGIQIVKQMSASMLCDGPVLPIESDHIGIVKPFNKDDKSYVAFRTAYRDALTKPEDVPAVSAAELEVSTAALTTRPLEVACGASSDQTITVPFTAAQHPGQRLVDAVVSMQQGSNLKSRFAEVKNRTANEVEVHYRIEGLDQDRSGKCASIGRATLTVAFLLAGPPASAKPADTAQTRISQSTRGDFSPAFAGVAGNVTIIRNAEPQSNVPSASVTVTPPSAPLSHLVLRGETEGDKNALSPIKQPRSQAVVMPEQPSNVSSQRGTSLWIDARRRNRTTEPMLQIAAVRSLVLVKSPPHHLGRISQREGLDVKH